MKKINILLLILSVFMMTACGEENVNPVSEGLIPKEITNEKVDRNTDIIELSNTYIDKIDELINDDSTGKVLEEEYPLSRDLIETETLERYDLYDVNILSLASASYFLDNISRDLIMKSNYEENTFEVIEDYTNANPDDPFEKAVKVKYKILMNDTLIQYVYYDEDGYDRVNGFFVTIDMVDGKLELSSKFISYDLETEFYGHYRDTYYMEDGYSLMKNIFTDIETGEISGIIFKEYNPKNKTYMLCKIDNSIEDEPRKSAAFYNIDEDAYYSTHFINDVEKYVYISKYKDDNRIISLDHDAGGVDFIYNLMYIDGWDTIDKVEYTTTLMNNDNEITLPYGVRVDVRESSGVSLRGSYINSSENQEVKFNLSGTGLEPPITYNEYLNLLEDVREQLATLHAEFTEEHYSDIESQFNTVFEYLDKSIIEDIAEQNKRG